MTRILTAAGAVLLASSLSACVQAQSPERTSFDGLVGSQSVDTDGDVEMNGVALSLHGRVGGDAVLNGAAVEVDARIGGDLETNGGAAEVRATVAGRTLINAGAVELSGTFQGPVEVNAGAAELDGVFVQALQIAAGSLSFDGEAQAPVAINGAGRNRNWLGRARPDESRVVISGALLQGGRICAHEVRFETGAALGARVQVIADSPPAYAEGVDSANIAFTQRENACA